MDDDIFADLLVGTNITKTPPKPDPIRKESVRSSSDLTSKRTGDSEPRLQAASIVDDEQDTTPAQQRSAAVEPEPMVTISKVELVELVRSTVEESVQRTVLGVVKSLRAVLEDMSARIDASSRPAAAPTSDNQQQSRRLEEAINDLAENMHSRFTTVDLAVKEAERGIQALRDKHELLDAQKQLAELSAQVQACEKQRKAEAETPREEKVSTPAPSEPPTPAAQPVAAPPASPAQSHQFVAPAPVTYAPPPQPAPAAPPAPAPSPVQAAPPAVPAAPPAPVPPTPVPQPQVVAAPSYQPPPASAPYQAPLPPQGPPYPYSQPPPFTSVQQDAYAPPQAPFQYPPQPAPASAPQPPAPSLPPPPFQPPPHGPPMPAPGHPVHGPPPPGPPLPPQAPVPQAPPPMPEPMHAQMMPGAPPPPPAQPQPNYGPAVPRYPSLPNQPYMFARPPPQAPPVPEGPPAMPARTSTTNVPLEQIISDISGMGFERTKVLGVVADLQRNGQSVDLNVILDRLMNGKY